MHSFRRNQASRSSDSDCAGLAMLAERELSACFRAVSELFGVEEATLSAEEWLHELMERDHLPSSLHEWRSITVKAASRLAGRLNTSDLLAESQPR
jgi:hypothetical protein